MISKLLKPFLLLLFFVVLLPAHVVLADTGPKPTMNFEFKQELPGEELTITAGVLYECEQSDCSAASPLGEAGPQRFTCQANSCHALSYGFKPYHRLRIQFSDGQTRQSNVFKTAGFDSKYTVTVRPEDLLVKAQFNLSPSPYVVTKLVVYACVLVSVGLVIGLIVLLRRRLAKN